MRILVTGAAGMIGSNLSKELLKLGHEVIGIDNLWRGSLDNLEDQGCIDHPNFSLNIADLSSFGDWVDYFKDIDCVYHLADIVAGIGYVFGMKDSFLERI